MSDLRRQIIDEIFALRPPAIGAEANARRVFERYELEELKQLVERLRNGSEAGDVADEPGDQDSGTADTRVGLVERMKQLNESRESAGRAGARPASDVPRRQPDDRRTGHKPTVIIVGADKGGVGKTTVSRTLLDYFGARNVPIRAFDAESPRGTLKRFHPEVTDVVDVTSVPDQMRILDTLTTSDAAVTVIDVRAGLLSATLRVLRDIGFLEAAKRGQITLAVFHILGPSIASLDEISDIAPFVVDGKYYLVKNFINNTSFFEWDHTTYDSYFKKIKDAVDITIPKLNEMAYEQVELASIPFVTFIANKGAQGETGTYSFVLRGYVRHWLGNVWAEFDRVRLPEIVAANVAGAARRV